MTFDKNARFSAYGGFLTHNYDTKTTQIHNWNLSVQRQLGGNWLAKVQDIKVEAHTPIVNTTEKPLPDCPALGQSRLDSIQSRAWGKTHAILV